jgi:hypothetical protein
MRMRRVSSEAARAIGYDPDKQWLDVRYTTGNATYRYLDVPAAIYDELRSAPSVGTYLNQCVKPQYRYVVLRQGARDKDHRITIN